MGIIFSDKARHIQIKDLLGSPQGRIILSRLQAGRDGGDELGFGSTPHRLSQEDLELLKDEWIYFEASDDCWYARFEKPVNEIRAILGLPPQNMPKKLLKKDEALVEKIDPSTLPEEKRTYVENYAKGIFNIIKKEYDAGKNPDVSYYKNTYKKIIRDNNGMWGAECASYFGQVLTDLLQKAGIIVGLKRQKKLAAVYNDTDLTPEEHQAAFEYVRDHVSGIRFGIPSADTVEAISKRLERKYTNMPQEQIDDKAQKLFAKFQEYKREFFNIFPDAKEGRDFYYRKAEQQPVIKSAEDKDKQPDKHIDMWHMMAETRFDETLENAPEAIFKLMQKAQKSSINEEDTRGLDEIKKSNTFNSYYFAIKILSWFDNDLNFYKKRRKVKSTATPAQVADSDDVFKQDFPNVNAYGDIVESLLKEDKEEICCICGEPIEGYGNNPEPYKHEGRCCDACNAKFVIPARLANLNNEE